MNKFLCLTLIGLLAGCAAQQQEVKKQVDMKTCLMNEATARVQDGSALAAPIRTTAKKIVAVCLIGDETPETQQSALQTTQDILTNLMKNK